MEGRTMKIEDLERVLDYTCDVCLLNHPTEQHSAFKPIKVAAMPTPRADQTAVLIEYWHISKAHSHCGHERRQYVVRWFCKRFPDVKPTVAYKWLERAIE